jgi:hypothetical protein
MNDAAVHQNTGNDVVIRRTWFSRADHGSSNKRATRFHGVLWNRLCTAIGVHGDQLLPMPSTLHVLACASRDWLCFSHWSPVGLRPGVVLTAQLIAARQEHATVVTS